MYNGYLMENLGNITSALACQFACLIYDQFPGCNYFSYNAVRENCQLLSSSVRTCDLIRGPPNPTFEECSEKPSKKRNKNLRNKAELIHNFIITVRGFEAELSKS